MYISTVCYARQKLSNPHASLAFELKKKKNYEIPIQFRMTKNEPTNLLMESPIMQQPVVYEHDPTEAISISNGSINFHFIRKFSKNEFIHTEFTQ